MLGREFSYRHLSSSLSDGINELENNDKEVLSSLRRRRDVERGRNNKRYAYNDFETIDWLKDLTFLPKIDPVVPNSNFLAKIKMFFSKALYSGSGWVAVTLVGMLTGIISLLIFISINWLTDIRMGYCVYNFLLNQKDCEWLDGLDNRTVTSSPRWITYKTAFLNHGYSETNSNIISGFIYISISMFFGVFSAFVVKEIAPYACNSGVAEIKTILSGFVIHGFLGFFTAMVKSFGIILSVSSGLNIGSESPLIHIGTAIANLVCRAFPKYKNSEAKKREILTAGASAGISAAFNAPISGLLFSFEETSHYFSFKTMWRTFWCTLIAALFRFHLYNYSSSSVFAKNSISSADTWKLFELIPFTIIGILGGLFGCMFIKISSMINYGRKNTRLGSFPILETAVSVLFISSLSYIFPLTRMDNHRLMSQLGGDCIQQKSFPSRLCNFDNNATDPSNLHASNTVDVLSAEVVELLYILALKILFYIFSVSLKLPSGFMYPLMVIGAIMGRIISHLVNIISLKYPILFPLYPSCQNNDALCANPSLYAMIGAAAFLCGVTRLTVTIVVIIIEVTESAVIIVPIMVAVIVAKLVGESIIRNNIFQKSIELNNYPHLNFNMDKTIVGTLTQIIQFKKKRSTNTSLTIFTESNMKISDIQNTFDLPYYCYPIVDKLGSSVLVGSITSFDLFNAFKKFASTREDINPDIEVTFTSTNQVENAHLGIQAEEKLDLSQYVNRNPYMVSPNISIDVLIQHFLYLGLHCVFVVYHGQLVDIVTKKDLLRYINNI